MKANAVAILALLTLACEPEATPAPAHVPAPSAPSAVSAELAPVPLAVVPQPAPAAPTPAPVDALLQPAEQRRSAFTRTKPLPHLVAFDGCSGGGLGDELDLNRAKNRDDDSGSPDDVPQMTVTDFLADMGPTAPKHRAKWTSDIAAKVAQREGYPLALTGVLLRAKAQGKEECNCNSLDADLHDVHINLVAQVGQQADASAIVEVTPRIRHQHPKWTGSKLNGLKDQRVRVTGWVTFDNEHQDMITKGERATLWEIHPILHFEVWQGGGWKTVDAVL